MNITYFTVIGLLVCAYCNFFIIFYFKILKVSPQIATCVDTDSERYPRKFPMRKVCRVLVDVKDKVSPPRLPGNVRFGRRIGANRDSVPVYRPGSSVTASAPRV